MLYGFLVFHFIVVLLEDNKRLKKLLKDRSMPKKLRYTVRSDGFGEFSLLPYLSFLMNLMILIGKQISF